MLGFFSLPVSSKAEAAVRSTVRAGACGYDRGRMLHRLLREWPIGFPETEPDRSRAIVRRLAAALRAERTLGRAGHWTYDLNRHIALRQAHLSEASTLRRLRRSGPARTNPDTKKAPE
jgi:hypothetical protein